MSLVPGGRLGPYEILGRLGAGGMGEVWRARDTRLDRQVAIKVLPAELSANAQFKLRLEREARLISQLNHPNICILHDVGHDDSRDFLVMEFVEGETLAERLTRGKLSIEQVVRYGVEIADALDRAHKQGIVHRDLKPSNVMLTKSGVKLLDFGLAKSASGVFSDSSQTALATQHKDHSLTAEGTIVGTFQYMAPEQLEGLEADARTDIFALGCVLYEMATGRRAFEGKTRTSLIAAIVGSTPRPISESEPLTPPALDNIVRKCLEKDPENRWHSAHDIADQLRWVAEAGSQAGVPIAVVSRRKSRERLAWSLAAILALALAAVGVAAWMRPRVEPVRARFGVLPPPKVTWTAFNSFSLSPDGKYLVFFGAEDRPEGRLYLRAMDSMEITPLAGTDDASFPFWSPDSASIAFFVPGKLKKIDVTGGPAQTICDARDGRGGSWNKDGVILFAPDPRSVIHSVTATGGTPAPLLALDTAGKETAQQWPKFLPDGEHFVYKSIRPEGERAIFVAPVEGKKPPRKLVAADAAEIGGPRHLIFVRESTAFVQEIDLRTLELKGTPVPIVENLGTNEGTGYVAITTSSSGVLAYRASQAGARNRLAWFDRSGRELGAILEPGFYFDAAISPDGRKIAFAVADPAKQMVSDIWIVDAVRGTRSRLTFDPGDEFAPVWAPDGSTVAYSLAAGDTRKILRKLASGAGEPQVMLDRADLRAITDWSRDGRFLAFMGQDAALDIGVAALDGAAWKPEVFLKTPFDEGGARFSPDGKWIAYVSAENGRPEVFLQTFPPSGGKWQISTAGGAQPVWRGDGRELFYLDLQTRLMSVKLELDGDTVEASVPETLFQAQLGGPLLAWSHYDVTSDGQKFLFDPPSEASSAVPITVVFGWNAKRAK